MTAGALGAGNDSIDAQQRAATTEANITVGASPSSSNVTVTEEIIITGHRNGDAQSVQFINAIGNRASNLVWNGTDSDGNVTYVDRDVLAHGTRYAAREWDSTYGWNGSETHFGVSFSQTEAELGAYMTQVKARNAAFSDFILDSAPLIGTAKSLQQLATGTNWVAGESVNRWVEGGSLAISVLPFGNKIADGVVWAGGKSIGLGRQAVSWAATRMDDMAAAWRGVGVPNNTTSSVDLFRRTENVGEFSDLKVPMQLRYVDQAAQEGGIGLQGVKVRVVRDPELIGKDLYGYTHPDGSIDLYPDAFTNTEQLVKTLGHERTHTMQIDLFGHPNNYADDALRMNQELRLNENAAHGIEESFWQYYLQNKTGKLSGFE